MGTCASNNKRLMIVRQHSASIKLGKATIHATEAKNNGIIMASSTAQQMNTANNARQYDEQHNQEHLSIDAKLQKQDSGLNLLPPELQRNMTVMSDESVFEREKRMVVLLVNNQQDKPSQLAVIDVDFQSPGFSRVIRRLNLPLPGEELFSLGCMRNSHSTLHEMEYTAKECTQFTLVAPVPSHSRIYVLKLMEAPIAGSTGNGNGHVPFSKRTNEHLADVNGTKNGDLFRLDRRTFCPVDRRRRSISEEEKSSSPTTSPYTSMSSSPTLPSRSTVSTGSVTIPIATRFPNFGGAMAVHMRHALAFTTEWGDLDKILCQTPNIKPPKMGSQDLLQNDDFLETFGNKVNVWDMRRRTLFQTIKLEPKEDGRWPICIRMVHQAELTHGFICTALGSSIYHLHKSTKTGLFSADRVVKFSSVTVGEWPGDVPDVPAFLTDMVISMDDQHLYVCAAFHGFVAQLNISDPFRPTLTQKVFLGGIVCRTMGILHGSKMPLGKDSAMRSYNTERRFFTGRPFEGGPARMQLSLDGRRLFVSNGFLRNWDEHFFPQLMERGSMIVLVHIDPVGTNPMKLDPNIGINFEPDEQQQQQQHLVDDHRKRGGGGDKNGSATQPQQQQHFYAREMRFLNGDSTSDLL
ncbi:hypothetical protein niasHT_037295 [Heterodera trifolii]|uniref:Uncharacterized protein n=1 Tax=Heterodera trifolii TaxID=157864 RepID=A0ABD2J0B9_9BILA